MSGDRQDWQTTMAQFYVRLYTCAWENLAPFLGSATTLDLVAVSCKTLAESYPFLSRLVWHAEGLEAESLHRAIADEAEAHVKAGCEQLLQYLQGLVREIGGALLAQRLSAATEKLRLAFEPALSTPTPTEEVETSATPADPQEAALPLLQSMAAASSQPVLPLAGTTTDAA